MIFWVIGVLKMFQRFFYSIMNYLRRFGVFWGLPHSISNLGIHFRGQPPSLAVGRRGGSPWKWLVILGNINVNCKWLKQLLGVPRNANMRIWQLWELLYLVRWLQCVGPLVFAATHRGAPRRTILFLPLWDILLHRVDLACVCDA